MNTNFHSLSTIEQAQANDALTDIAVALDDASVLMREVVLHALPAREYDELRAFFGTIRDAQHRLCELFYNTEVRELDPIITDDEAAALIEPLPPTADEMLAVLLADLDRGSITLSNFQCQLDVHGIPQVHPCEQEGCLSNVQFDDEPFCFVHSPDEGSSRRGYSYIRNHSVRVEGFLG